MIKLVATMIIGISLTLNSAIAKDWRNNKPSAEKQQFCERMIKKFGHRSAQINDGWYGKEVMRPKRSSWEWSHSKEPGWFSDELFYVYKQQTADGFKHQGYCKWREDGWLVVYMNHFEWGEVAVCDSWGDSETVCR